MFEFDDKVIQKNRFRSYREIIQKKRFLCLIDKKV